MKRPDGEAAIASGTGLNIGDDVGPIERAEDGEASGGLKES
jgi:hypothetical protein